MFFVVTGRADPLTAQTLNIFPLEFTPRVDETNGCLDAVVVAQMSDGSEDYGGRRATEVLYAALRYIQSMFVSGKLNKENII